MAATAADARGSRDLLRGLLKGVSRSFYLSLRLLPAPVRRQIGLAYLLARATDTIADTRVLPREDRLEALEWLRQRILGAHFHPFPAERLIQGQASAAEATLLRRIEEALGLLEGLEPGDLALVRQVLETITSGQILDLRRFPDDAEGRVHSLASAAELSDYTYRVAGCVGEFWTRVCLAHLPLPVHMDVERMVRLGISFGQGLQMVNILRDLPTDLRIGRCYVPSSELAPLGLDPADLLRPEIEATFRPLHSKLMAQAEHLLLSGWEYTMGLPVSWWRVRVACALPLLIGRRTLGLMGATKILDPGSRVKVERKEVRRLLARTLLAAPFPTRFGRLWKAVSA